MSVLMVWYGMAQDRYKYSKSDLFTGAVKMMERAQSTISYFDRDRTRVGKEERGSMALLLSSTREIK